MDYRCAMCVMNVCCCRISCTPVCNNRVCISGFFRDFFFAGKVKIFCCNLVLLSYYIVWRNTRSICERYFLVKDFYKRHQGGFNTKMCLRCNNLENGFSVRQLSTRICIH